MSKCMQHNTIKVPQGNAWQLLLPLKTAHWSGKDLVTETIDYRALEDVQVLIDGVEWDDWQMTEDGPLCNIPADMPLGPHNTVITATYFGVEVKASYFENFTIVAWSFESNVGEHLLDAPLVSEAAYIYVGITDDQELEELKQQYRNAIAATETARLQYEAAKEEFDEKAEALDDVAQQTTLMEGIAAQAKDSTVAKQATLINKTAQVLEAISGIHIDLPENIATTDDVTAAKNAILAAIGNINVEGVDWLLQFFDITAAFTANEVTEQEAIDVQQEVLDDVWPDCPVGSGGAAAYAARRNWADDTEADVRYYNSTIGLQCSPIPVTDPVVYNGYRFYPDGTYESIE